MEEIQHFSHKHPLTFFDDKENDYEDQKPYLCSICWLPILSSPSYTCSINGCKIFLHKPCAELPRKLEKSRHHPIQYSFHTLSLEPRSAPGDSHSRGKLCQNFTYKCMKCKFDIHPLLAVPVEIKIKHKSHPSHPLVAICRETLSLCDGCGEEHKGFFFSCQECNFWIHQDCTLLPSAVKLARHPHPFILTYSLSDMEVLNSKCLICDGFMLRNIGLYFCSECTSFAHVSCAKSDMENLKNETRLELIQLPDEGDTFPSLVIRRFLESNPIPDHQDIKDYKKLTIERYHKHRLMLHDGISSSREASLVCDVCLQPIIISSPFYRCLQSDDCQFLAHNICANLPSSVHLYIAWDLTQVFLLRDPGFFISAFPCFFCRRPCNGFCFIHILHEPVYWLFDLECMVAPNTIKHASHGQHALFRTTRPSDSEIPLKCCSGRSLFHDVYRCIVCDFYIHMKCALLPQRTQHKFDKHPLELITRSSNEQEHDQYNNCFCEFCEQVINRKKWYYGCGKCEQYFHINCIPSVGYLSKVKFGGSLNISCHIHPVTLTRMLTVGSQRCGCCKKIIQGFVDEMAFHCSECDFWIHFSCARDTATDETSSESLLHLKFHELVDSATDETSSELMLYSKLDELGVETMYRDYLDYFL